MLFIETPIFTSEIQSLLPDEYYRNLQGDLSIRPDAGNIITGSGGLRKIRFGLKGIGKEAVSGLFITGTRPIQSICSLHAKRMSRKI